MQLGSDIDGTGSSHNTGENRWPISSDGTRLVVGSPGFKIPGSSVAYGEARVYERDSGTSAWVEVGAGPVV